MEPLTIVKSTWLSRKPDQYSGFMTFLLTGALLIMSVTEFAGIFAADHWLPASHSLVFTSHEYWRAWTSLFIHGDLEHLLSNSILFIPLTYLMAGYYSFWLFPLLGIFLGGITNLIVLNTLPSETYLVGISGVVYWLGAAWLTLFVLIDRHERLRRRIAIALFLSLMLFVPETYKPHISYLSHFIGYFLGILSGVVYYLIKKEDFDRAEVVEYIYDEEPKDEESTLSS